MGEGTGANSTFSWQGHRGARGLYPENTIDGFRKAIDHGMNTMELDVVVTSDSVVVLSHEPWLSSEICLQPSGEKIIEGTEKQFSIWTMTYEEVKKCDCGSKAHPRFPDQLKVKTFKPSLAEVIVAVEAYTLAKKKSPAFYNIEVKSDPENEAKYHPDVSLFVEMVLKVISEHGIADRANIQSFDVRVLQYLHDVHPKTKLAYLVENQPDAQHCIDSVLGFIPDIYSPNYEVVNEGMAEYLHGIDVSLIPWTINTKEDMRRLIRLGVDGIITDYPDIAQEVAKKH